MNKRVMLIGPINAGKTTLIKALGDINNVKKTQTIILNDLTIDVPGEYLEIRRLNYTLINTAVDSAAVFIVQDATKNIPSIPFGFVKVFRVPVYGVITKVDHEKADIERAISFLTECGISKDKIFLTSSLTGEGIHKLKNCILSIVSEKC